MLRKTVLPKRRWEYAEGNEEFQLSKNILHYYLFAGIVCSYLLYTLRLRNLLNGAKSLSLCNNMNLF